MAINQCAPCSDPCYQSAAANNKYTFFSAVLNILCAMYRARTPDAATTFRINGNYNGTNVEVVPLTANKISRVRSLMVGTEDTNTDYRFFSKNAVGPVYTPIAPNLDYLSNSGAVLPLNEDGWMESLIGESIVITTTGGAVDLLGTGVKL